MDDSPIFQRLNTGGRCVPAAGTGPHEEFLALPCGESQMLGVLSLPAQTAKPGVGVVIVVGGPQYRVGSHRQFVLLARRLARAGHAVLRFDVRGMGDSGGQAWPDFRDLDEDINAAIAGLRQRLPSIEGVVLWGLCDGASASLMFAHRQKDSPIIGLCLANPWVRSTATMAQTTVKHYYKARLRQPQFWRKLLSGGVAVKAVTELLSNLANAFVRHSPRSEVSTSISSRAQPMPFQQQMALGWRSFKGPILLLLSENDYTAKEFVEALNQGNEWSGALGRLGLTRVDLQQTDHTCSDREGREELENSTLHWLQLLVSDREKVETVK